MVTFRHIVIEPISHGTVEHHHVHEPIHHIIEEAKPKRIAHFEWKIGPTRDIHPKIVEEPLDIVLLDNQKTTASITPKDDVGGPASLEGTPIWESSDPSIVSVTPAADGLSAELRTTGTETAAGTQVTITVEADADLSGEIFEISDVINVTVNGSQAVNLGLATTPPEHV